jgi:hypothetical protein
VIRFSSSVMSCMPYPLHPRALSRHPSYFRAV